MKGSIFFVCISLLLGKTSLAEDDLYTNFLKAEESSTKVEFALELGQQLYHKGLYDSSCYFFSYPLSLSPEQVELAQLADAYYWLGYAKRGAKEFPEAISAFQLAHNCFEKLGIKDKVGLTLWYIGEMELNTGALNEAENHLTLADGYFNNYGRPHFDHLFQQNLGYLYWKQGKYADAIERLSKAIAFNENDGVHKSQVLNLYGLSLQRLGEYRVGLEHYQEAISIAKRFENIELLGWPLNNLGDLYHENGQLDSAQYYLEQAFRLALPYDFPVLEATTLINLAELAISRDQYQEAIAYTEQAIASCKNLPDPAAYIWALKTGITASELAHKPTLQREYYDTYIQVLESQNSKLQGYQTTTLSQEVTIALLEHEKEQLETRMANNPMPSQEEWIAQLWLPILGCALMLGLLIGGKWYWQRHREVSTAQVLYKDLQRTQEKLIQLEAKNRHLDKEIKQKEAFRKKLLKSQKVGPKN